jgi:hypothetical protein
MQCGLRARWLVLHHRCRRNQVQHWSADRRFIRERKVVEVFDPEGTLLRSFQANDRPGTAWTVAVDADGNIWVSTCCPEATLRKIDVTGQLLTTVGSTGPDDGLFHEMATTQVAFDEAGRMYTGQVPVPGAADLIQVRRGWPLRHALRGSGGYRGRHRLPVGHRARWGGQRVHQRLLRRCGPAGLAEEVPPSRGTF